MGIRSRWVLLHPAATCIAFWPSTARSANAATSYTIPSTKKPELLAQAPSQVWSLDITKLMGPAKWFYVYLHVNVVSSGENTMWYRPACEIVY